MYIIEQSIISCLLTIILTGSTKLYIHPPLNPKTCIFPSKHGDQLAPAVLATRSIRTMMKRSFNTSYQVHLVHATYKGIDTCNVRDVGRFDIQSHILQQNEQLSLRGRKDIREHVYSLIKRSIISNHLGSSWINNALKESEESVEEWLIPSAFGSSTITFMDAIRLKHVMSYPHIVSNMVTSPNGQHGLTNEPFTPKWPSTHFYVHPYNQYGAPFKMITTFTPRIKYDFDTSGIWLLVSLVSCFPSLWTLINDRVKSNNEWYGWFLTFVSHYHLVPGIRNDTNVRFSKYSKNPYKYEDHHSTETIELEKLKTMIEHAVEEENFRTDIGKFASICKNINPNKIGTAYVSPRCSLLRVIRNWTTQSQQEECNFLLVHRNNMGREFHDSFQTESGARYKLCYLAILDNTIGDDFDDWNVLGCCRHREDYFTKWWLFERRGYQPYEAEKYIYESEIGNSNYKIDSRAKVPQRILEEWQLAIYIKYDDNFEDLQNDYYEAIGGQKEVRINCIVLYYYFAFMIGYFLFFL